MRNKLLLLVIFLSSCCHQSGEVLEKRTGFYWDRGSPEPIMVFAYQIAVAETVWVVSDIEYEKGDTLK